MDWEVITLREACERGGGDIQTGPFGSQLHASDYVPSGVPSIMPQNIGDNRILRDGIARIRQEDAERLDRYRVRRGDIVYSRRGDVGKRALVRPAEDGWLCGTGCLRVRLGNSGIDSRYAAYYLGHPDVREWILRHAVGATMPNLNTSILEALPFVVPPVREQEPIADYLTAIEDKIDVNRRISETLEEIARTVFQSWFVDFDPVRGTATVPDDIRPLFPDRLVDSPIGPVPQGWQVAPLGDHVMNVRNQVNPREIPDDTPYIGLEHMPRRHIALGEWGSAAGLESGKFVFTSGDVLFGKLRPYFHKVGLAPVDGICSTDILVLRPRDPSWVALAMMIASSDSMVARVDAASTGTRMPRASWKDLASLAVVVPPPIVVEAFQKLAGPMLSRIVAGTHENRVLAEFRDTLLPILISGELRLTEAAGVSSGRVTRQTGRSPLNE